MLAELGFNAFIVDVYGTGIRPNTPETCEAEPTAATDLAMFSVRKILSEFTN
jgi:hypothetical protein